MPRIVSVIPPKDDSDITKAQGTKILLDNGEYLRHVHKITLVAEPESPWKAIIEVYPSNQEQINALLADVEVIKRDQEYSRLDEIKKEIQQLQDEKMLIERKHLSELTGLSIAGVANVPMEGTYLLPEGEKILPVTGKVKDIHGVIHSVPDLKGEHDDSEEHY
ncbi:TPA: hypothetical protein NU789_000143 [Acinetobacter baumannii]|uniref:hypothetical protein n=1 Tax=Acinetobacter baumannii TaxID=470 RepID=UPI000D0125B6|nr:hypothetical protein [Acinetobacter baumannii]PRO11304.1 hypothetical protein B9W31_16870 [Acinetobacter baumannii]PRO22798.1 hypothetical protein B9W57_18620 [Acinetobacter baumannii]PRO33724.1 hypothetical protein B9W69_15825 [Acinetobacter baumannii]TLT27053.1 hypothetical protein FD872_07055 [Acinetobacter baumannii]TLT69867.1 hypothetical protein FD891_17585 [Acinetobacter baumannii]